MTKLRNLKEQKNLSTKELAKLTGTTYQMINFMETGKRKGSIDTLMKLAKILDVTLEEIVEEVNK